MGVAPNAKIKKAGKTKQKTHRLVRFETGSPCRDAKASPKAQISNGGRPVDLVRLHHTSHQIAF